MGLNKNIPEEVRTERNVGNLYERLEDARRKREQILETPAPANVDRRTQKTVSMPLSRSFPTLKPPAQDVAENPSGSRLDWAVPWLLGLVIFGVIFAFAVG